MSDQKVEQNGGKPETGRSMVEMLGVLAVMGVLSMTGIYMYSTAMTKHKANEVANSVSGANVTMQAGQGAAITEVPGVDIQAKSLRLLHEKGKIDLDEEQKEQYTGDSYLSIDFGEDKAACKHLKIMYEGSDAWQFIGDCNKED